MATPYTQVHKNYKLYINCTYRISLDDLLKVRQGQNKVITSNIFSNRRLTELLMINFMIHLQTTIKLLNWCCQTKDEHVFSCLSCIH